MNITDLFTLPEHRLQHIVRLLFADSEYIWQTIANKPLQVISPGEWNTGAGPDFRNMAVIVDGRVLVGNGEFHRRSAEWRAHGHDFDPKYADVLLHIVLEDDAGETFAEHTLALDPGVVLALLRVVPEPGSQVDNTGIDGEELQEYAYRRLLRKTAQALDLCRTLSPVQAFAELVRLFLEHRAQKKSRPQGVKNLYNTDATRLEQTEPALLVHDLASGHIGDLYARLSALVHRTWIDAGKATRTELLINALLPVALAVAEERNRTDLLAWFWSQRAAHQYSSLRKKFPGIGQEYIWKQQGLLEYAATQKFGPDRVAESDDHRERHYTEAVRKLLMPGLSIRISLGWRLKNNGDAENQ